MNKKIINDLARVIAMVDERFDKPYDELPFHQQLTCRAMARYIIRVLAKWKEVRR
jgi:hypothetical protein